MLLGLQHQIAPGPYLRIRCLACKCPETQATSYEYRERFVLLRSIPLTPFRRVNYIECATCNTKYTSPIALAELPYLLPDELARLLNPPVGRWKGGLAVGSLVLSPIPFLGLLVSLISMATNGSRSGHWSRTISLAGCGISALVTSVAIVFAMLAAMGV
ncbi:hypothetical protein NA78x_002928 [Anatilimnocola sp. NA78]|uniref:hypothetical protein n=1 Tax=Anatilimnocola sp. NA78 TaxID=3415683 RepID=UPI003CE5646B